MHTKAIAALTQFCDFLSFKQFCCCHFLHFRFAKWNVQVICISWMSDVCKKANVEYFTQNLIIFTFQNMTTILFTYNCFCFMTFTLSWCLTPLYTDSNTTHWSRGWGIRIALDDPRMQEIYDISDTKPISNLSFTKKTKIQAWNAVLVGKINLC